MQTEKSTGEPTVCDSETRTGPLHPCRGLPTKIVVTASQHGASQVAAEQLSQREKGKRWSFQKNIPPRAVSARLQRARPRGSDAMAEVTCRYVERGASEARARVSRHRPRPRRRLEPSHARLDARDDT